MSVLACFSIKGGVGKTTTAVSLAHIAAAKGYRTLLWDLDSQGAASFYLNARNSKQFDWSMANDVKQLGKYVVPSDYDNLDVIPNKFSNQRLDEILTDDGSVKTRLKAILFPIMKDYDLIILDCPPGISSLVDNALTAADHTVVPTIPAPLSVRTVRHLRKYLNQEHIDTKLLPFFCMQDSRRSSHKSIVEYHQKVDGDELLSSVVPYSAVVERMSVKKRPLAKYAGVSTAAAAYQALFEEVEQKIGLKQAPALSVFDSFKADLLQANAELMAEETAKTGTEQKAPVAAVSYIPRNARILRARRPVRPARLGVSS